MMVGDCMRVMLKRKRMMMKTTMMLRVCVTVTMKIMRRC